MRYLLLLTLFLTGCASAPVESLPQNCHPLGVDHDGHVHEHGHSCKKK